MKQEHSSGARPLLWIIVAAVVVIGLGGLLVWGFLEGRGEATEEAKREQPVRPAVAVTQTNAGTSTITLGPDLQKQVDIQVMQPQAVPYQEQLQAYGSVLELQPFTDLSNTIASAKAQLAIAQAKLTASQAAFQRAQVLHNNGQNISTAQLQAAEATYRSDEAAVQGAQVQTQNAAASANQAWGPVLGQSLTEGTTLAKELVQHRKVLIQVTLPLGSSITHAPQTTSIETSTGQHVTIEFVSFAPRTDPKFQGVSFYYTADAAAGALPGMNVIAFLPVGQPTPGIEIPTSAVVWLQGRAWVYVRTAADKFTRREIPTTEPRPGGGYIVPGLATTPGPQAGPPISAVAGAVPGLSTNEPLVVKGAQMLLSQEFSAQIQMGED